MHVLTSSIIFFHMHTQLFIDPSMTIPLQWPSGKYSLPQAATGCPDTDWFSGWRYQDNEDSDNANSWEPSNLSGYLKVDLGRNYRTYYCTKTFSSESGFSWPKGNYCIARYGGSCPSGFSDGSVYWDDEDGDNENSLEDPIPDGNYGRNTLTHYCCRNDASPANEILLPTKEPFVLYRRYGVCQKVRGMREPVLLKLHFDDADGDNEDSCSGDHPDATCAGNQDLYMCYYSPQ